MQELRQQCSERSPVVAVRQDAGVEVGYHLVRERDLGLRPLAGAQRDVAGSYFRVGALAAGHGAARLQVMRVQVRAAGLGATTAKATRIYVACAHARAKIGACRAGTQLQGP